MSLFTYLSSVDRRSEKFEPLLYHRFTRIYENILKLFEFHVLMVLVMCLQIWTKRMPSFALRSTSGRWRRRRRKRNRRLFSGRGDGNAKTERPSR